MIATVLLLLVHFSREVRGESIKFIPDEITLHIETVSTVAYLFDGIKSGSNYVISSENEHIACLKNGNITVQYQDGGNGSIGLEGVSIGRTKIVCRNVNTGILLPSKLKVIVVRPDRVIDTIFTVCVATLISIIYINFGAALDWSQLKGILKKPVGPAIAFCGQFGFQPIIAYMLGQLLFPDSHSQQLGLLFIGASPGGGASNLWTLLLGGNVGLSIVATTISTIAAFAMMPLWLFTLGKMIFESGNIQVPYGQISTYVFGLIVPLAVGFFIQKYLKNAAIFLTKIMKAFTIILLVFIIIFATVTNLYLFELFSWQIVVAGMCLPWLGYTFGYIISKLLRQPHNDCIAIAIEIGIQNTGIAIFLLRFTLPQPEADLTTVIPVSVAILTPLPLLVLYICKKIATRCGLDSISKKRNPELQMTSQDNNPS